MPTYDQRTGHNDYAEIGFLSTCIRGIVANFTDGIDFRDVL